MNKLFLVLSLVLLTSNTYSQTADELYKQAFELTKAQNYSKSNAILDKAFKLDSTQVVYYQLKRDNFFHLKKYQEAYNILTRGISSMPNNAENVCGKRRIFY